MPKSFKSLPEKHLSGPPSGFSKDIYQIILEEALPLIFLVKQARHINELPFSPVVYANSNFFERMRMERKAMLNRPFRDFISTIFRDPNDVKKYFDILLSEKRIFKMRVPLREPLERGSGGNCQYVEANSRILQTKEGNVYVQGIFSDATDYAKLSDSLDTAEQQLSLLRREFQRLGGYGKIIGKSKEMMKTFSLVERVSKVNTTVLIMGETGSGKEMIAQEIHRRSPGRKRFIPVNCGALPEGLLESELFGHVKGAFTGADRDNKGLFRAASGGTIFLDEIGELLLPLQVKLLRVIEENKVRPVGSDQDYEIDIRIIAATNQNLEEMVKEGNFREDLFYRLSVFPIFIPSLRERPEDITPLAMHFLKSISQKMGKTITGFHSKALKKLLSHTWPGNVRELENAIEYSCVVARGKTIDEEDIQLHRSMDSIKRRVFPEESESPVIAAEKKLIEETLAQTNGNQQKAAEILGFSRVTLWRKMKKLRMK